ncbi:MAG: dihydrofolate reductase family protein [Jatrophihabitans sp.]|uniref:dihydrofolate reductase family protein n=1 Tax=Jatrophihabitans sp. TaxID=1932789 RepID=UPI003F7EB10B
MVQVLVYSMSASTDGFVADRDGAIDWTAPDEELFAVHLERVRGVGVHLCGRRLYETMLIWETDPSFADTDDQREFAEVWAALPKVVFASRPVELRGNARLATGSVEDEVAAAVASTGQDVEIGGATLAAAAMAAGLVDEFHLFRAPVLLGGGTPYFPPLAARVPLELLGLRTFANGIVHEHYRRAST